MTNLLGMFAKHWQPGAVKTRLAASIGPEAAARLHRHFVQTLLHRLEGVADRQILCFAPSGTEKDFRQLDLGSWTLEQQVSGDLGTRMREFFRQQRSAWPSCHCVLVGSDSPDLPREYVDEAFSKLRDFPVVLGPTDDGGYYLIGLSRDIATIFADISWSTPQVWPQTVSHLRATQIPYHVLPQWYDVDEIAGLERLRKSMPLPPQT